MAQTVATEQHPPAADVPGFRQISAPYADAYAGLERFLDEQLLAFEPEVRPLVEYTFAHSGKKLRPLLVFMSAAQAQPEPAVIRAAAIVELVHLATLVHDDILDEAQTRHRTATLVERYGAHAAVLLGDALFAHALYLATEYPEVTVCREVALATRQVCSGEIAQTFARGQIPDRDSYYRFIRLKTAELFGVSAFLGAHLSQPQYAEQCRAFAMHLGVAYQMYDDVADLFAAEERAGKTLGTDMQSGKFTLPVLLWLELLPAAEKAAAVNRLLQHKLDAAQLRAELLLKGVPDLLKQAFVDELNAARGCFDEAGQSATALLQLTDFLEAAWNKFTME